MNASLATAALLALTCLATPRFGRAQSDTRAAVAEALYQQARDLMAAGKLDEACPKFAESQRLDPATGTLLNLAACHERQGKLATAWLEYNDALFAARRDGREDRVEYARQRAAELAPQLSRVTLLFAAGADHPGLTLELDGASVGRAAIGAPTPVDPGTHTIRASAPGKKPWLQTITVGARADQQSITIPPLEDAAAETLPVATPARPAPTQGAETRPSHADELLVRPLPSSVYLAGGVTLALTLGAGMTGAAYLNKKEVYEEARRAGPSPELEASERTARTYGYVNLGLWAGAALAAASTTYFYVTRPARPAVARALPWATRDAAGLSLAGGF